jgi:hypothetical protein
MRPTDFVALTSDVMDNYNSVGFLSDTAIVYFVIPHINGFFSRDIFHGHEVF